MAMGTGIMENIQTESGITTRTSLENYSWIDFLVTPFASCMTGLEHLQFIPARWANIEAEDDLMIERPCSGAIISNKMFHNMDSVEKRI